MSAARGPAARRARALTLALRLASATTLANTTALAVLAGLGCSATPLPADLGRAQAAERDDPPAAIALYRQLQARCDRGQPLGRDDCAVADVRAAELEERLGQAHAALADWQRAAAHTHEPDTGARALARSAALQHERLGDDAAASALAWQTIERYPDAPAADEALRLAIRLDGARDPAALARRLDELLARLARREIGDNLLWERGELERRRGDVAAALQRYRALVDGYPRSPLRDDACWQAAQLLRTHGDPRGALAYLQLILDTRRDAWFTGSYNSVVLDDAQLLTGDIYLDDLGDVPRAVRAFELLADDYPDSRLRDDALYRLACARLRQHTPPDADDRQQACRALARLLRQFPDGNQARRGRALFSELGCA